MENLKQAEPIINKVSDNQTLPKRFSTVGAGLCNISGSVFFKLLK